MGIAGFARMRQRNLEKGGAKSPLALVTPEEDFICSVCDREFRSKFALNSHARIHREVKED